MQQKLGEAVDAARKACLDAEMDYCKALKFEKAAHSYARRLRYGSKKGRAAVERATIEVETSRALWNVAKADLEAALQAETDYMLTGMFGGSLKRVGP